MGKVDTRMNIGVVGVGWWGKNIVNTLDQFNAISKVIVFDKRSEVYEKFRDNRKTFFVDSLDGLLLDPSIAAVCLATPPATHYDYSKHILLAGKHLLVEKPPAYEVSQVQELGKIAATKNLVYMLNALYLFLEPIQKIKQMLDSGDLKNLRFVQMFRIGDEMRREGAGIQRLKETMFANGIDVIEDLFFHDAAILLYLFGDFEYHSSEKLCLYDTSLCDTVRIKLSVRGVPVELTLSWTMAGRRRGMVIYDQHCIVEYDALKNDNQISKYNLVENRADNYSFPAIAPLGGLLDFYLRCIAGKDVNYLGSEFMERITTIWRKIINEH